MDVVIALVISIIGEYYCGIDFLTLFTFTGVSVSIYKSWINYTNDKTARR